MPSDRKQNMTVVSDHIEEVLDKAAENDSVEGTTIDNTVVSI
jgi:hypothetical protein